MRKASVISRSGYFVVTLSLSPVEITDQAIPYYGNPGPSDTLCILVPNSQGDKPPNIHTSSEMSPPIFDDELSLEIARMGGKNSTSCQYGVPGLVLTTVVTKLNETVNRLLNPCLKQ